MSYTIFDNDSIIGVVSHVEDYSGLNYVKGVYDSKDYVVVDGVLLRKPPNPTNEPWHVYDYDKVSNSMVLNIQKTDNKAKEIRRELFKYVDKVNPIWLASMNAVQQLQVANYRQDLLDITKQENYPVDIVWPIVPYFLK